MIENRRAIAKAVTERLLTGFRYLYIHGTVKSREEFCKAVGALPQSYAAMERGERYCSLENVSLAGQVYGFSLDWLFYERGEMFAA